MRRKSWILIFFILSFGSEVYAQLPPLDYTIYGGRILSSGSIISLGIGWPSIYGQYTFPLKERFDLGIRGDFYYGSPITSFHVMIGTGFDFPMRLYIWGDEKWDIAMKFEPGIFVGFSDDYIPGVRWDLDVTIWGIKFEPGVLFSIHSIDSLFIIFGAGIPLNIVIVVPEEDSVFDTHIDAFIPLALFGGVELSISSTICFFSFVKFGPTIINHEVWRGGRKRRDTDVDTFFQLFFGFHFRL